jgi:hypothetical protein
MLVVGLLACVAPSWVVSDGLVAGQKDGLAPAWALGAEIELTVDGWGASEDWLLVSSDEAVAAPLPAGADRDTGSSDGAVFVVAAVGVGEATLSLVNKGKEVWTGDVVVGAPDSVRLIAGPAARVPGYPDVPDPILVVGDTEAVLGVRLFDGDTELFGPGTVEAVGSGNLSVSTSADSGGDLQLGDSLDWLQVRAEQSGDGTIQVLTGDVDTTFAVVVVQEGAVAALDVVVEPSDGAEKFDRLSAGAAATDANGALVLGLVPEWSSAGDSDVDPGDVASYLYQPDDQIDVTVTVAGLSAEVTLPTNALVVKESTGLGCDHGGIGVAGGVVCAGLALLLVTRARGWRGALVAAGLVSSGCATVYAPGRVAAPMLDRAGELEIAGALGTGVTEVSTDLALPHGLMVHAGGQWRVTERRTHGLGDLGVGAWYGPEVRGIRLGAQVGYGLGHLDDVVGTAWDVDGTWHYSALLTRLQGSGWFGYETPGASGALALRVVGQDVRHDAGSAAPDATARMIFFEPGVATRFGVRDVKFETGFSLSMPMFYADPLPSFPVPLSAWFAVVVHPVVFGGPRATP